MTSDPGQAPDQSPAFQILLDDQPVTEDRFSPSLRLNLQSFRQTYPQYRHRLLQGEDLRALLADHFDAEVLATYDALLPYAYRADLARYCLLYQFGGLYSDLAYLHVQPMALEPGQELILFHDVADLHSVPSISNALILARPRHPLMEAAIRQVVAHHRAFFLGKSPLEPTGPYMLGRLLQDRPADETVVLGQSHLINLDRNRRANIVKLLPGGELVALRNKGQNTSIHELIAGGGNSYAGLWAEGRVWADAVPFPQPSPVPPPVAPPPPPPPPPKRPQRLLDRIAALGRRWSER